jgi:hypothetical protein
MADEQELSGESGSEQIARHRSPAWPFIPLAKAIERTREFYKARREGIAAPSAANIAWGMKPKSGAGGQTISALKQYGLMREAESGVVLTDLALRIVRDQREVSAERDKQIEEAALSPKIFAELWGKWDADLPSDADVEYYLVQENQFSEDAAKGVLASYKSTIRFAKLAASDKLVQDGNLGDRISPEKEDPPPKTPIPASGASLMEGEQIVFSYRQGPSHGVRVLVTGEVDGKILEAVKLFIKLEESREPSAAKLDDETSS